jgi:hypothetical protein
MSFDMVALIAIPSLRTASRYRQSLHSSSVLSTIRRVWELKDAERSSQFFEVVAAPVVPPGHYPKDWPNI